MQDDAATSFGVPLPAPSVFDGLDTEARVSLEAELV